MCKTKFQLYNFVIILVIYKVEYNFYVEAKTNLDLVLGNTVNFPLYVLSL